MEGYTMKNIKLIEYNYSHAAKLADMWKRSGENCFANRN